MASGQIMAVGGVSLPGTLAAQARVLVGGSTPAEAFAVYHFLDGLTRYVDFTKCELHGYDGGGLTVGIKMSASVASGDARWEIGIRRIGDDIEDVETSHSYQYNELYAPAPSVIGEVAYSEVTFAEGPDMDDWKNLEMACVRVRRVGNGVGDDLAGIAQLWNIGIKET